MARRRYGSALEDFLPGAGELTRLCDSTSSPAKSDQFIGCVEAVNIPDLTENDGTKVPPMPGIVVIAASLFQQEKI